MSVVLDDIGLSLDDVLLVPQKSDIKSRFSGEIDLSTEIVPGLSIKYPLMSACMNTCTEVEMALEMSRLGGAGIIHRFMSVTEQIEQLNTPGINPIILCIGAKKDGLERVCKVHEEGIPIDAINIDVAHGHSDWVINQIYEIKSLWDFPVIAGNVATFDGALELAEAGADCVRIGIGSGSICSTRLQTGCGVPQLTAILESNKVKKYYPNLKLIADGGMKNPGDIVKCLAAGADVIMSGRLFSCCEEAPGETFFSAGKKYKSYTGMSSSLVQSSIKGVNKPISVEGVTSDVPVKGSLESIFNNIVYNILSGFSYCSAKSIKELQEKAVFIRQTSAGRKESSTHIFEENR